MLLHSEIINNIISISIVYFKKEDICMKKDNLQKELDDLKDWQENQYNPGRYIGTGRVPKVVSGLSKYPVLLIILGLIGLLPLTIILIFSEVNLIELLLFLAVPAVFIVGGILRLKNR